MKTLKGIRTTALAAALALAVSLAGTIGTANAGTITNLTIWHALTAGDIISSPRQQALPSNPIAVAGNLLTLLDEAATGVINFPGDNNLSNNTIGHFLDSNISLPLFTSGCLAACRATIISLGDFDSVTLMKFTFTVTVPTYETIQHDDGVSLFVAGDTTTNLLPVGASAPTNSVATGPILLAPGNYDLWYAEANSLPAVLVATEVPVPEPATMFLGGLGLIAFGYAARRRLFGR